jgi:hypothetical protein
LPDALKPTHAAGIIDAATYDGWVRAAQNMYGSNTTFQRDEAIRSGALAAMTLMLAAQGKGLVSCPMIGFNPVAVAEAFSLRPTDVPVMMVTVGYPGRSNWPKKPRKEVSEVLKFAGLRFPEPRMPGFRIFWIYDGTLYKNRDVAALAHCTADHCRLHDGAGDGRQSRLHADQAEILFLA